MAAQKVERLMIGERTSWPIVLVLRSSRRKVNADDLDLHLGQLLNQIKEDLAVIDGDRFQGCLDEEEFISVINGCFKLIRNGVVAKGVASGAFHRVASVLLKPVCGIAIIKYANATIDKVSSDVLDPINNPPKGKFIRRIEWFVEENSQEKDSIVLKIDVRSGFATWLEQDKLREQRELEEERQQLLSSSSRHSSLKDAVDSGFALAGQAIGALTDTMSTESSSKNSDEKENLRPKSLSDVLSTGVAMATQTLGAVFDTAKRSSSKLEKKLSEISNGSSETFSSTESHENVELNVSRVSRKSQSFAIAVPQI